MRKIIAVTVLWCVIASVQAQTIYRCAAEGKPTSFQNAPCSGTQRQVNAVSYTPDAVGAYRPDTRSRPYAARGRRSLATAATISHLSSSACELARAKRDNALGRNNQAGNYEARVRLNDAVQRACK